MRNVMLFLAASALLAICSLQAGCKSEKKNTLEGTWERVEARFTVAGKEVESPRKAIKIFTKNHWVIIEQEPNRQKFSGEGTDSELLIAAKTFDAITGTYTLKGDILTESIDFSLDPNWVGISITFQIRWEGDRWIQTGKMQGDVESYEVWKRIE